MKVPFTDLKAQHAPIKEELCRAFEKVIDSGEFAGGPFVAKFERDFAAYCGTKHAVGVGSGTDALRLTLAAMGVGPGDEVITVPMSFIATAEAISLTGAKPVFVDIDPTTYTMNPELLRKVLSGKTKAIVPVQLFGQAADMDPILTFAREHGLRVIEDAAQSHGAEYGGRKVGSLGDAGCFSFYPAKNLGAIGEAGAVVTDDAALAEKIRVLRDHGQSAKHHHTLIGWNGRMDEIQGAALGIKLRDLDSGNASRRSHAAEYERLLSGVEGIVLPATGHNRSHVFHVHAIRSADRKSLTRVLDENGIGYGIHYPTPIHLQPAYQFLGHSRGAFPVSELCADTFLSLPVFPELNQAQIETVAAAVTQASAICLTA
ncbi:MAG: DegT/DnrJ/EryC1/StrS family aminotransferase [Luteolibacter sp.]